MYKIHYVWELCREKFHKMLKINTLRIFLRPFLGVRLGRFGVLGLISVFFLAFLEGCGAGDSTEKGVPCVPMVESSLFRACFEGGRRFVEVKSFVGKDSLVNRFLFEGPVDRVVTLSSSQIGFMERLGLQNHIVAVGEGNLVADSGLYSRVKDGSLPQVYTGHALSLEPLVALAPDLVMTFATGHGDDDYERINALGLSMMLTSEWQENSPVAKAEWIKLYGMLFDAGDGALVHRADSIFRQESEVYRAISSALNRTKEGEGAVCPRVLAGMSYGGVWYAPGGESYTAKLIRDAGGCYLWASDKTRELKLSMEEVLALADSVDVWVNPGMFSTPEEILAAEPRAERIKAFREKRVYQNDGRVGPGGGNDFYEGAVGRPAELLWNVAKIVNLGIMPNIGPYFLDTTYKWYRNIYNF